MPRTYDDISHLRQPYLQTRLGGPQSEAEGLGVYMTSGAVDAAPLAVHKGFGVYETSGRVDAAPLAIHRGFGVDETSGPVDAAPLAIHRGFGAATLAAARVRAPSFSRPRPAGGSMHYPVRPHVPARTSTVHYPVRPHIPPAASYGARMGGAVQMPATAPAPEPQPGSGWGSSCCNERNTFCCDAAAGLGSGELPTTTSLLALGALAALGIWAATRR